MSKASTPPAGRLKLLRHPVSAPHAYIPATCSPPQSLAPASQPPRTVSSPLRSATPGRYHLTLPEWPHLELALSMASSVFAAPTPPSTRVATIAESLANHMRPFYTVSFLGCRAASLDLEFPEWTRLVVVKRTLNRSSSRSPLRLAGMALKQCACFCLAAHTPRWTRQLCHFRFAA
ncbi:hypothetical protein ZWY2020_052035 [Hordeum vulgare]|nr:hypothetical protein ZWY2020_052035 [Hordeum vulgare]